MKKIPFVFTLVAFTCSVLQAQPSDTNAATEQPPTPPSTASIDLSDARILGWRVAKASSNLQEHASLDPKSDYWKALDFEDTLVVTVRHLNALITQGRADVSNMDLLLNAIDLSSIPAIHCCENCDELTFLFSRRFIPNETLDELKKLAGLSDENMGIAINYEGRSWLDCCAPPVTVHLLDFRNTLRWSLTFALILLAIFIYLAWYTPLLQSKDATTGRYVYSLSRAQLAFWSYIILSSYFYIYIGTDDTEVLNTTALILLGISSATTAVGQTIDRSAELAGKRRGAGARKGHNLLLNIISDDNGVSIHRLQTVVFNLVFGVIFVRTVLYDLSMPEFSTEQLVLLGISNGAYTALKTNEGTPGPDSGTSPTQGNTPPATPQPSSTPPGAGTTAAKGPGDPPSPPSQPAAG